MAAIKLQKAIFSILAVITSLFVRLYGAAVFVTVKSEELAYSPCFLSGGWLLCVTNP